MALGGDAVASGAQSTALGFEASTNGFANSTAIGNGAQATATHQMVLGTASNTYTTPGITSGLSKDRQSGPLEIVTSDANGNLATNTASGLGLATQDALDDTTEGVAMSMALTRIPVTLPEGSDFGVAIGYGNFRGENGMAFGGTARLTDHLFLNGGATFGSTSSSSTGTAVGAAYIW